MEVLHFLQKGGENMPILKQDSQENDKPAEVDAWSMRLFEEYMLASEKIQVKSNEVNE